MNRRQAVWRIALLMGGAMVGSEVLLSGQSLPGKAPRASPTTTGRSWTRSATRSSLATDIPGAKAVKIGAFMTLMVTDCYNDRQHAAFAEGLRRINDACSAKYGTAFMGSTPAQRTELANALEVGAAGPVRLKKAKDDPAHYFRMMKELTVLGLFLVRDRLHAGGALRRGARAPPRASPLSKS
jgi:hypothetical protein